MSEAKGMDIKMNFGKIILELMNGVEGKIVDEMLENTFSGIRSLIDEKITMFYSQQIAQDGI